MLKLNLSDRITAVTKLVPAGVNACDVGCDHGFAAIHLVQEGICPKVLAMDINRGPLSRAQEHIESAGLSSYIETRLSDGLEKLNIGEAECMIAAGMGGRLAVKILEDYPEKTKSLRYLVLQPQSELSFVRKYLRSRGFVIRKEDMVFEDGKFYPMMLAEADADKDGMSDLIGRKKRAFLENEGGVCSAEKAGKRVVDADRQAYLESLEDEFGPCLIREKHPVLLEYLSWWEGQQNKIWKNVQNYPERRAQVEEELTRIRDAREAALRRTAPRGFTDAQPAGNALPERRWES